MHFSPVNFEALYAQQLKANAKMDIKKQEAEVE